MAQQRTQWIDLDPLELVNDAVDADWFPFLQKSMLGPPADAFRDLLNRKIDLATRHFKFESLPEFAGFLAYLKAASNYDGMYKALYINAEIARDAKWMQYVEKGRQASAIAGVETSAVAEAAKKRKKEKKDQRKRDKKAREGVEPEDLKLEGLKMEEEVEEAHLEEMD